MGNNNFDAAPAISGIGAGGGTTVDGNSTYGAVGVGGETGYTTAELDIGPERIRGNKGRSEIAVLVIGAACAVCYPVEEHEGTLSTKVGTDNGDDASSKDTPAVV